MQKVKITVLRTMFNEDLAAEYGTRRTYLMSFSSGRAGVLCRLCKAGGTL